MKQIKCPLKSISKLFQPRRPKAQQEEAVYDSIFSTHTNYELSFELSYQ